jgi:hypothetical protein
MQAATEKIRERGWGFCLSLASTERGKALAGETAPATAATRTRTDEGQPQPSGYELTGCLSARLLPDWSRGGYSRWGETADRALGDYARLPLEKARLLAP